VRREMRVRRARFAREVGNASEEGDIISASEIVLAFGMREVAQRLHERAAGLWAR